MTMTIDEIRTIVQEHRKGADENKLCYCGDFINRHYCSDHSAVPINESEDCDLRLLLAAEYLRWFDSLE